MKIKDGVARSSTENVSVDDRSPPKTVTGDDRRTRSGKDFSFATFIASVKSRVVDVHRSSRPERRTAPVHRSASNACSNGFARSAPPSAGAVPKERAAPMTVDTMTTEAPSTELVVPVAPAPTPATEPTPEPEAVAVTEERPVKAPRKTAGKKTKTLELTLTVIGTADGEWRAELKQGTTFLARDLAVAAAAVSRAAKELHDDLSTPIDAVIEEARSQQAAKVAALEAELEAARRTLADLD
jgi:uncharacterized protein DUF6319